MRALPRYRTRRARLHSAQLLLFSLLLLAGSAQAQRVERTLEHQNVARSFIVANAPAKTDAPRPTVVVMHGRRVADAPNRSSAPLDGLATREGFAVVYPAGIAGVWNWPTRAGTSETPLATAGAAPADDLGFLNRLIDVLVGERIADPARVYVSGASMGGFMTFGLMCAIPDKFAAAAAMIATMTESQIETCKPARAVPLLMLAGTLDTLIPYEGRTLPAGRLLSIADTFDFWKRLHNCKAMKISRVGDLSKVGDRRTATTSVEHSDCASKASLRLYRVEGGGHTLPSLAPQSDDERKRFGPRSTEFETSEEVWGFFKEFRLSR